MKSGNRSLFLDKISSKSPFICPQIWPCSWTSAHLSTVLWNAWLSYVTYNRCSKWYITCTVKTWFQCRQWWYNGSTSSAKIFIWGRTWHSKWHEDLLSCVRMNDGLRAESMKASSCRQQPRDSNVWKGRKRGPTYVRYNTYLFDLLCFPQLNMWAMQ